MRILTAAEASREATAQLLAESKDYIVIGEGVPDPKCCFGTTKDLHKEFPDQVFDSPISENGVTGVCIGAAISGLKPIHIHMRQDFLLYAMDQIVNNGAKWNSMFGGNGGNVPMVIKAFTGRGWGAGHQHAQNLESLFAHIPGLKVVVPSNARNAKGLLISAARDPNPVMILEPRWIHHLTSDVPEEMYETPFKAEWVVKKEAPFITLISWGACMTLCHKISEQSGVDIDVVDVQCLSNIDFDTIREAVDSSGRAFVVCDSWGDGIASWITTQVSGSGYYAIKPCYPSSSPGITQDYYPNYNDLALLINEWCETSILMIEKESHDVPDKSYTGPF